MSGVRSAPRDGDGRTSTAAVAAQPHGAVHVSGLQAQCVSERQQRGSSTRPAQPQWARVVNNHGGASSEWRLGAAVDVVMKRRPGGNRPWPSVVVFCVISGFAPKQSFHIGGLGVWRRPSASRGRRQSAEQHESVERLVTRGGVAKRRVEVLLQAWCGAGGRVWCTRLMQRRGPGCRTV